MSSLSTSTFSKRFKLALGLPLIIFLFYTLSFELLSHQLDNTFVQDLLKVRSGKTTCLLIGDSHINDTFRDNISECENLALGGVTLPMLEDALVSILKENKLEKLVIGFAPHYFSDKRLKSKSSSFQDIAEWFTPLPNLITRNSLVQGIISRYQKSNLDYSIFFRKFPPRNEIPWSEQSIKYKNQKSQEEVTDHKIIVPLKSSQFYMVFQNIINLLHTHKIQACFITTPNLDFYYDGVRESVSPTEWNELIKELQAKNHKYIDYNLLEKISEKNFRDLEHLNFNGSKKYARKVFKTCF